MSVEGCFQPNDEKLYLIPFGGLGQFGANMMGLYVSGKLYVLDCGVSFPDARKLGVDAMIPDVMSFVENLGGIAAYIITHGHEDHIGALPLFYRFFQAPIYATAWTTELIANKFLRFGFDNPPPITVVPYTQTQKIGDLKVRWIYMTHSLPEASALFIETPVASIFHSGDFKLDPAPVVGPLTDFAALKEVADIGVDIMLCDSTNANKPGRTSTEASILEPLTTRLSEAKAKVFITCFSSNVARIQTIINASHEAGRRLCLVGNSLVTTLNHALSAKLISDPGQTLCLSDEAKYLESHKVCYLLTGSQGEYRGALARVVYGEMRDVVIEPEDTIIFSSRIIPGNEKTVLNMMNEIEKIGAHTLTNKSHPEVHVSGHAYSEEIIDLVNILRPKVFVPVHGSFIHLNSNNALGKSLPSAILDGFIANGEIVSFDSDLHFTRIIQLEFERLFVDAFSKALMPNDVLRERLRVGEHGQVIISGVLNSKKRKWYADPEVTLIGLGETMYYSHADVRDQVLDVLYNATNKKDFWQLDAEAMREQLRVGTRRVMANIYGRKPVVLILSHIVS